MTSISWQNGPILRNGAIGTEQACCCAPDVCASQCSGNSTPSTITFTISNAAGLTFENFDPNGSYVVPRAYDIYASCFYYHGYFFPFDPGCKFPYSFISETHWANILIYPSQVQVRLSERTSGGCVGDRSIFYLSSDWSSSLCSRPTGFPITGTAAATSSYFGLLSFDWSIDL